MVLVKRSVDHVSMNGNETKAYFSQRRDTVRSWCCNDYVNKALPGGRDEAETTEKPVWWRGGCAADHKLRSALTSLRTHRTHRPSSCLPFISLLRRPRVFFTRWARALRDSLRARGVRGSACGAHCCGKPTRERPTILVLYYLGNYDLENALRRRSSYCLAIPYISTPSRTPPRLGVFKFPPFCSTPASRAAVRIDVRSG